ncbi:Arsenite oxidase small subunit precursor [hydrothermal vent metagenome]|uniref:Arsenite oxidase small subunit n=1 Tax=hydrothermal vent metagenome TaxID=652676 RepID=A0A3B1DX71_9ZZZZ
MKKDIPSNSRRGFFKTAGILAGTAVVAPAVMARGNSKAKQSLFNDYKKEKIGSLKALKSAGELDFNYPDSDSMCKAVYIEGKVKAYSTICTHKGCPTMYNKSAGVFECPCHHSKFDAANEGQMIIGHATGKLPQVILEIDGDNIYAVGFEGLIFGRINNTRG